MSAGYTPGTWTPFILNRPLSEIPAYVETCIRASGGEDFYFVMDEAGEVDVCHVGNGPKAKTNAHLIATAPDMRAALIVAREFISTDRNSLADCALPPHGPMDPDDAAAVADYDAALLQIDAAIQKATPPTTTGSQP